MSPDKKIAILVVCTLTGLGLKEAKDLVEAAPKPVKEAIADAAEDTKKQLMKLAQVTVSSK